MTMQMKRLALACALMAGTTCAVAADFTDKTRGEVTFEFANDQTPLTLTVQQAPDVYAYEHTEINTKLATVTVGTNSGEARNLALTWGENSAMTVQDHEYASVTNGNPDDQPLWLRLDPVNTGSSVTPATPETVGNETYWVFDTAAAVSTDIVMATGGTIAAGTYPVTLKAAIYNN